MRAYFSAVTIAALTLSSVIPERGAAQGNKTPQTAMERQIQNAVDVGEGDFEIHMLRLKMVQQPDNLEVRLALAKSYETIGSPELALEHYRLAAGRFPDSAEVHLLLAKSLRRLGAGSQAARELQDFLAAHPPTSPDLPSLLGIILDEQKQWTEGERCHRQALALAPQSDALHNNLGYNLLMQGKNDAAAEEFREALKLNQHSQVARNNLGMALALKQDQTAVNWQSVGDPAAAHNNVAALLIGQGKYVEARRELDLALGYNRAYPPALNNLRLVSQLDGKPAVIPVKPAQTRWGKLKAELYKSFVDDRDQHGTAETNTPDNRRGL